MRDTDVAADAAEDAFLEQLELLGVRIQQPEDTPLFTPEPQAKMTPMHWKWSDLAPLMDELQERLQLVPGGGRRTLKLANPGLPYGTTPTFWASIQYILPGEVATAHRHTPEAFRFVMYGKGCRTTVDGENYEMNAGDLVLTPSWAWHDHVHHGDEPMIWLDVLDISLVRSFEATFYEDFCEDVQEVSDTPQASYQQFGSGLLRPPGAPSTSSANPLLAYPKAQTEAALEAASGLPADPANDVILEYQNPTNGGPAMYSMSMKAQLLRPGFRGALHRELGSKVYWAIEGSGTLVVGEQEFNWTAGDFLAVPSWVPHRHENRGDAPARLFRVDDSPVLRAMGIFREETLPNDWTPGGKVTAH